jgi:hypothetical protein
MTLEQLEAQFGDTLGDRLLTLRKPQQQLIADAAYEHGFIPTLQKLMLSTPALRQVMREAGYGDCTNCEEWFPQLELTEGDASFLEIGEPVPMLCEECKLADSDDWAAPPPPEPTTPEEIKAAEEKRAKARQAVIDQTARAQERQAILDQFEEPT